MVTAGDPITEFTLNPGFKELAEAVVACEIEAVTASISSSSAVGSTIAVLPAEGPGRWRTVYLRSSVPTVRYSNCMYSESRMFNNIQVCMDGYKPIACTYT